MNTLDYIRVVLVQPTHAGNIGATARAMANMGLRDLRLVQPKDFPSSTATARAVGANWILEQATLCDSLLEAIKDCSLVIGATARYRTIQWPQQAVELAMQHAAFQAQKQPVGLVFGRESRGLTNQEIESCHYLVRIPVDDNFASLNLASAVLIMLYELRKIVEGEEGLDLSVSDQKDDHASAQEMQHFYGHLQSLLLKLDFAKGGKTKLIRKLTRLFNRAWLTAQEVKMLRGLLTAIEQKIKEE